MLPLADLALLAHGAVWLLLALLVLLVAVLARQVRQLDARIVRAGALMVNQRLSVGDPAPPVTAQTLDGRAVTVGAAPAQARGSLVFFLAPDCPISRSLVPVLRSLGESEPGLGVTLASDGLDASTHAGFVAEQGLERYDYVVSESLGRAYGVGKIPYGVLIDENRRIAALGIVNSREHLESLFEARELGVASLQDFISRADTGPETTYHDATR